MLGVLQGTQVEGSRAGIPEIPAPGSDLSPAVLDGMVVEQGRLSLAVAPPGEGRFGLSGNGDGSLEGIAATPVVGRDQAHGIGSGKAVGVGNIGRRREVFQEKSIKHEIWNPFMARQDFFLVLIVPFLFNFVKPFF